MLLLGKQFDTKENKRRKSLLPDVYLSSNSQEIISTLKKFFCVCFIDDTCILPIQRSMCSDMIMKMNSYFY